MNCTLNTTREGRVYVKSSLFDTNEFVLWGAGQINGVSGASPETGFILGRDGAPVGVVKNKGQVWTVELSGRLQKDENFLMQSYAQAIPFHIQVRYGTGIDTGDAYAADSILCLCTCYLTAYSIGAASASQSDQSEIVMQSVTFTTGFVNLIRPNNQFTIFKGAQFKATTIPLQIVGYDKAPFGSPVAGLEVALVASPVDCDTYTSMIYYKLRGDTVWSEVTTNTAYQYSVGLNLSRQARFVKYMGDANFAFGTTSGYGVFQFDLADNNFPQNNPIRFLDYSPLLTANNHAVGYVPVNHGMVGVTQNGTAITLDSRAERTSFVAIPDMQLRMAAVGTYDDDSVIIAARSATLAAAGADHSLLFNYNLKSQRFLHYEKLARAVTASDPITAIAGRAGRVTAGTEGGMIYSYLPGARFNEPVVFQGKKRNVSLIPYIQAIHALSENIIYASITQKFRTPPPGTVLIDSIGNDLYCSLDGGTTWSLEKQGLSFLGFTETEDGLVGYGATGIWANAGFGICRTTVGYDSFEGNGFLAYSNNG